MAVLVTIALSVTSSSTNSVHQRSLFFAHHHICIPLQSELPPIQCQSALQQQVIPSQSGTKANQLARPDSRNAVATRLLDTHYNARTFADRDL
jgi:hypothetical protein